MYFFRTRTYRPIHASKVNLENPSQPKEKRKKKHHPPTYHPPAPEKQSKLRINDTKTTNAIGLFSLPSLKREKHL